MEPLFLTLEEVLTIQRDQIARYGGQSGLRDGNLLDSALAMPAQSFGGEFLHGDLFDMAAAYLYHLVQNHPFVDGNKRVGVAAALVFLDLNGVDVNAPDDEIEELVLGVARGEIDKPGVAAFFRSTSIS